MTDKPTTPPSSFGPGFGGEHKPFVPDMPQDRYNPATLAQLKQRWLAARKEQS